jgi:hypothetical protein
MTGRDIVNDYYGISSSLVAGSLKVGNFPARPPRWDSLQLLKSTLREYNCAGGWNIKNFN